MESGIRLRALFVILLLIVAGCGNDSAESDATRADTGQPPTTGGGASDPNELRAHCGQVELGDPTDIHLPDTPLDEAATAAYNEALIAVGGEPELFSGYAWSVAVQEESRLVLFGRAIGTILANEAPYADAELVLTNTGWSPTRWGQCRMVVDAPGFGNATLVLDPDFEPNPTSPELHVLINERACASGQPPIGREVLPVVVADEEKITITVLVEPVTGGGTCPSNPWHPITITLDGPWGNRQVFDGSMVPPAARPWPPTPDSLNR